VNAAVWLAAIVPALLSSDPASLMKGAGLLTIRVCVQVLAISRRPRWRAGTVGRGFCSSPERCR
jgi:hypothetical protein